MRILVTIPHFHRPTNLGYYGSLHPDSGPRRRSLMDCLTSLHQAFGLGQGLLYPRGGCTRPTNGTEGTVLDVRVCTTGGDHLVDGMPPDLFRHHPTDAQPPLLGYECHAVLRDNIGKYDWYVFLEDDLVITDPLFFDKLAWFQNLAGDTQRVLQPNRFELANTPPVFRLYIDGQPNSDVAVPPRADVSAPPRIAAPFLGRTVTFQQTDNPHCGGFFLTDAQMRRWAAMPDFLDRAASYIGPLESAATLGLIRHFTVYKPSREDAGFLELQHGDARYLGRRLRFGGEPPYHFTVASEKS